MNKAHIELIKRNYEKACDDYIKAFCNAYNLRNDTFWVADEVGGILSIGDYYFNFSDIKTAVDKQASDEELFAWYDYHILTGYDSGLKEINLTSWLKGFPHPTREEIDAMYKEQEKKNLEEMKSIIFTRKEIKDKASKI